MDLALNNLQRLICHKTQPSSITGASPSNCLVSYIQDTRLEEGLTFLLKKEKQPKMRWIFEEYYIKFFFSPKFADSSLTILLLVMSRLWVIPFTFFKWLTLPPESGGANKDL